jgi:hypothetical protein
MLSYSTPPREVRSPGPVWSEYVNNQKLLGTPNAERVCVPVQHCWIGSGAGVIGDISVFGRATTAGSRCRWIHL